MEEAKVKKLVREGYGKLAASGSPCCGPQMAKEIGYSEKELGSVPQEAFSLGCGNPVALALLKTGETVLDLGSGSGFDCFLAARKVGSKGRVIGIDMTPEMLDKARENARKNGYGNVEFRLGEIENLPAADNSVDVVISNCVINLSADKRRVFEEAFRVLRPGGRLMISDIVLLKELPKDLKSSADAYVGCLAGAVMKKEYISLLKEAGFRDVKVVGEQRFPAELIITGSLEELKKGSARGLVEKVREFADSVVSVKVSGVKPRRGSRSGKYEGSKSRADTTA